MVVLSAKCKLKERVSYKAAESEVVLDFPAVGCHFTRVFFASSLFRLSLLIIDV